MSRYSAEVLCKVVDYDHITGKLTWKHRTEDMFDAAHKTASAKRWNSKHAGKPAFTTVSHGGYLTTTVFNKRLMAHRVAWCVYHQLDIPDGMVIDHINGVVDDNRIINLRVCNPAQNSKNVKKKRDGLRGAFFHKSNKKWQSSIRLHLGSYDTEAEASEAYEAVAKFIHGTFYLPNGKRITVSRVL